MHKSPPGSWFMPRSVILLLPVVGLLAAGSAAGCGRGGSSRGSGGSGMSSGRLTCKGHEAELSKRALAAAACQQDTDCRIVSLPLCSIQHIGCHFAALNPKRARPLHSAVAAYLSANCKLTKCECKKRPQRARCQAGRCVPVPR